MSRFLPLMAAALSAAAFVVAPAEAATNIIPSGWGTIVVTGTTGVLRAVSPWGPGSTASSAAAPVNGTPQAENTQWNHGSFWWDQDPSVNPTAVTWTVSLKQTYAIDRLVVQADNNDAYRVQYWNGSAWATAFDVPGLAGFGLMTRDSGVFAPITTSKFRFTALSGDNYYALGQFEAFGSAAPEPATWAMMLLGFAGLGFLGYRSAAKTASRAA